MGKGTGGEDRGVPRALTICRRYRLSSASKTPSSSHRQRISGSVSGGVPPLSLSSSSFSSRVILRGSGVG
jgi:hypothetical protein